MAISGDALRMIIGAETSGAQTSLTQLANVSEKELKRAVASIKPFADAIREQERAAAKAAATVTKAANDESKALEHVGFQSAAAKRELLVLAHELSQGSYSRFGGSVMVLAERTNLMELAFSRAGLAAIGLGGALIGGIALMAKGAIEADHFAKQLQLTGNYAAVTAESIQRLAEEQSKITGQTSGASRETIEAVAGSGLFSSATTGAVARAMGDYQRLTGEAAEDALKNFSRLRDGVARWAEETNRSMHYLSAAQYEQIKALEEAGNKDEAARVAVTALAATLESRGTPQLGYFARAWHWVKEEASQAAHAIESFGMPATLEDQINDARDRLNAAKSRAAMAGGGNSRWQSGVNSAQAALDALLEQQRLTNRSMASSSETAGANEVAIDQMKKRDEQAKASASAYRSLMSTVDSYNEATQEEQSAQASLSEAQRWSIEQHKRLDEAAKNLSRTQRAAISEAIDKAAAEREVADQLVAARRRNIAAVVEQTARQEQEDKIGEQFLATGEEKVAQIIRETQLIGLQGDALKRAQFMQQVDIDLAKASAGATAEKRKELEQFAQQIRDHYVTAINQATEAQKRWNSSMSNGAMRALDDYSKASQNAAELMSQTVANAMQSIEDTMVAAAMKGKLNFHEMVQAILADIVRLQIIRPLLGEGANFASEAVAAWSGSSSFFPTFANGLDYVPYDGYIASLHEGERVVSKQDVVNSRDGTTIHMGDTHLSVGAGVNMAQVNAALQQSNAQMEMRLRRLTRQGALA